jgi:CDP-diacylglycerol--serine O-phosphatidyltransferase
VSQTGARVVPLNRLNPRVRAKVMLPSLFTLGNMICGFSSVLMAFQGRFRIAAVLIAASIVLDIFDGAVARAVGAITPFGLQFDSLADLISFGIAPAVLVYTWALPSYPQWAWAGAMFWLACAAYRLARFNVTIDPLADKRYFIGLPSPGAAGVVIATVFAIDKPLEGPLLPIAAGVVPAALMATSFRFRSFRALISRRHLPLKIGFVAVIVLGLVLAPGATGIAVAYGYVLTAPLGWLTGPLRRRYLGPDSVAPPRRRLPSVIMPVEVDASVDGERAIVVVEDGAAADDGEVGEDIEGEVGGGAVRRP